MGTPSMTASDFDSRSGATSWARPFAFSLGSSSQTRRTGAVRPTLALALLCFLAFAAPASASIYTTSFFEAPSNGGFHNPLGISVDHGAGNVYVADNGTNSILKFDLSGNPVNFSGLGSNVLKGGETPAGSITYVSGVAVNPVSHALYTTDYYAHVVDEFNAEGKYTGQLTGAGTPGGLSWNPVAVTVDSSANVWVADPLGDAVDEFDSSGHFLTALNLANPGSGADSLLYATAVALDAAGNIYAAGYNPNTGYYQVDKFNSSLTFQSVLDPNAYVITVDPSNGKVFTTGSGTIAEFNSSGVQIAKLGEGIGVPAFGGVAVDPVTHVVYATDYVSGRVYIFTPVTNPQTLKIEKNGTGSGTVTGTAPLGFAAIQCGSTCEAEYVKGTQITLTAEPNERSTFSHWTGCESEIGNQCVVTLNAATEVKAEFTAIPQKALKVEKTGNSTGTVTGSASTGFTPINCGSTCTAEYNQGAQITLTAEPGFTSKVTSWTGCDEEPSPTECRVQMSEAKTVKAEFTAIPQKALKVEKTGNSTGTVTGSASTGFTPINCGSTCTAEYNQGAQITLTAEPSVFATLAGWSVEGHPGACPGTGTCIVEMSEVKTVKAEFALKKQTLTVAPTGPGLVSAGEGAISNCSGGGGTCVGTYDETSTVILIATPGAHNHITWSGCTHSSANTCEVTLGLAVANVHATFSINKHTLTVAPTGPGSVNANEGAISACAAHHLTCASAYDEASTITLTATPSAHSSFVAWSGCTHSSANTCEVEIGASDAGVTAAFASNKHTLSVVPTGSGSISANSGAISKCSSAGGLCSGEYIEAATLTLTASPIAGEGVAWSGCTYSSANTCEVTIGGSAASVQATFARITHALSIAKAGTGTGTVTCDGGPCDSRYNEGATLTLAATAASGSAFSGWSGAGCSGTGNCKVTIEADTTITATFDAKEEHKNPPSNVVRLGSVTQHGAALGLAITVPGPGTLSVSGKNLKNAADSATGPGKLTLRLQLTSAAREQLERKGRLKVKVTVIFTPSGGAAGTVSRTVTFKTRHTGKTGG